MGMKVLPVSQYCSEVENHSGVIRRVQIFFFYNQLLQRTRHTKPNYCFVFIIVCIVFVLFWLVGWFQLVILDPCLLSGILSPYSQF